MKLLLALLCSLSLGACATPRPPPQWVSGEVRATSERIVWEATRLGLQKNNFPVGAGLDPAHMTAVSGWRHSLAPFRGKGFRERCYVKWTHMGEDHWKLEVRVERDRNDDISHPLDPSYADWQPETDPPDRAQLVAQYIRSLLDQR